MSNSSVRRRLAAVMALDVVGYSTLMGKDEAGTLDRLKSLRRELVQPSINEHHGRTVKLMGDGLLAEFSSVVDALQCAVQIQEGVATRELDVAEEDRIALRVGVNLGDIIVEGSDIFGDGVNIAARLESLAEPGGICVSGPVYNAVGNKLPVSFEDLGVKEVKNIATPIHVYRVVTGSQPVTPVAPDSVRQQIAGRSTIAVLAFTNLSGDPDQEFFSDGITDDIITELSRYQSLNVLARNSSSVLTGDANDLGEISRKLNADFIVQGSVRKAGNRIRITAQLLEAESGASLWAEKFDRNIEDIFDIQDEVAAKIATMVPGRVDMARVSAFERSPTRHPNAYELVRRATAIIFNDYTNPEAVTLLKQALEIDPTYGEAHAQMATHCAYSLFSESTDFEEMSALVHKHGKAAVQHAPGDAIVLGALAEAYTMISEFEMAIQLGERALALNPNSFQVMGFVAEVKGYTGDPEGALALIDRAMQSDPYSSSSFKENRFDVLFMAGRYEQALEELAGWSNPPLHLTLAKAATLAHLGRLEEAKSEIAEFKANAPESLTIEKVAAAYRRMCANPEDGQRWIDGLRKAGVTSLEGQPTGQVISFRDKRSGS